MATVPRLDTRPADGNGIVGHLGQLVRLEVELGLAETRRVLVSAAIAASVAVAAAIALVASLVVLLAAAFAPLVGGTWEHLVIAGGGVALLSIAAIAASVWRLRRLSWPKEILRSLEENWRWLAAQLRSRLTSRSSGA